MCVVGGGGLVNCGDDAEDEQEGDIDDCSPEVDSTAAERTGDGERQDVGNELEARVDEVKLERTLG